MDKISMLLTFQAKFENANIMKARRSASGAKTTTPFSHVARCHNKSKSSSFLYDMDRVIPCKELVKLSGNMFPKSVVVYQATDEQGKKG